jgi:O-antigen/teichoic acid export membrane protein
MSSAPSKDLTSVFEHDSSASKMKLVSDSIATGVVFALVLTVGQRIIGFGRGILFCRLMTDQELGQWSMVWSYLMLLAPLAVLGLPGCFGKFTEHYRQKGQLGTFLSRITKISCLTTALMSIAIFIFPEKFAYILFRDESQAGLVRFLGVAILFVTASNFLTSLMESLRQVRTVTWMRFLTGASFAIFGVTLIWGWVDGPSAATTAFAISCLIGMVPAIYVWRKFRSELSDSGTKLGHGTMWKRIAPFAIWLWFSDLLHNLFEVSDRCMLIHLSSSTADQAQSMVGQYHSGRVVPLLMVSIASMLAGILLPYLSEAWEANNRKKAEALLRWAFKLTALGFTLGGVLILLVAPLLFDWILQGRYNDGLMVLPMTLVYCIWFGLYCVGQIYLWVAEKGKWAVLATALGLTVNVGLNLALIPIYGLQGAVFATAAGNATVLSLILMLNHQFECRIDPGVWVLAVAPMVLLLGPVFAVPAAMVLCLGCAFTTLMFKEEEKEMIKLEIKNRLGNYLGQ